jgi:hypothetical protein
MGMLVAFLIGMVNANGRHEQSCPCDEKIGAG